METTYSCATSYVWIVISYVLSCMFPRYDGLLVQFSLSQRGASDNMTDGRTDRQTWRNKCHTSLGCAAKNVDRWQGCMHSGCCMVATLMSSNKLTSWFWPLTCFRTLIFYDAARAPYFCQVPSSHDLSFVVTFPVSSVCILVTLTFWTFELQSTASVTRDVCQFPISFERLEPVVPEWDRRGRYHGDKLMSCFMLTVTIESLLCWRSEPVFCCVCCDKWFMCTCLIDARDVRSFFSSFDVVK